jgi:nucleotide-binding universal stress UspA family protein
MYSHILVPTDGSPLSLKGARAAADLAKKLNAKMTAVYVIPPYDKPYAGEGIYFGSKVAQKEYMDAMKEIADEALAKVNAFAREAQVACESESVVDTTPWEGILNAASQLNCDTIVMSSHGCGGVASVVLGSQTNRVLAHSKIPVVVCR